MTNRDSNLDEEIDLFDIFNWPPDGTIGSAAKLIYRIILNDNRKVERVQRHSGDVIIIYFENNTWPKSLTLAPKKRK